MIQQKKKSGTFLREWKDIKAWGYTNFIERNFVFDPDNGWFDKNGFLHVELVIEKK